MAGIYLALKVVGQAAARLAWAILRVGWPYLAAAVLGGLVAYYTPFFGHRAQLDGERSATEIWKQEAAKQTELSEQRWAGWSQCEADRGAERGLAELSANEAAVQCQLSIERARRSAVKIEEIIRVEPARDEAGCPVRSLIDPDSLRSALTGD